MNLPFTHAGVERTLNKHPRVQVALRKGTLTEAEARAKPWFLRMKLDAKDRAFKLVSADKDAISMAKDILKGQTTNPHDFSAWMKERDALRGITLGQLATEWTAAGLPDATAPRSSAAASRLQDQLDRALKWWSGKAAPTVTPVHMNQFAEWRRTQCRTGTGNRSVDLELSALSSLCQWAVARGKVPLNPFAVRPKYQPEATTHCHEAMPLSDEQLHRLLTWFWTDQPSTLNYQRTIAGAWLAYTALTGLRPTEPQFLHHLPATTTLSLSIKALAPGQVFTLRDGTKRLKVQRAKGGQNPVVNLHPVLADFHAIWTTWLDQHFPGSPLLFPHPDEITRPLCVGDDTTLLNKLLTDACTASQIQPCRPKGFGRAYYVRVRRSQGTDDIAIAGELGQTTNGELIRTTYGDGDDMAGGALFDWLPENDQHQPIATAWTLLRPTHHSNIIAL